MSILTWAKSPVVWGSPNGLASHVAEVGDQVVHHVVEVISCVNLEGRVEVLHGVCITKPWCFDLYARDFMILLGSVVKLEPSKRQMRAGIYTHWVKQKYTHIMWKAIIYLTLLVLIIILHKHNSHINHHLNLGISMLIKWFSDEYITNT